MSRRVTGPAPAAGDVLDQLFGVLADPTRRALLQRDVGEGPGPEWGKAAFEAEPGRVAPRLAHPAGVAHREFGVKASADQFHGIISSA